MGYYVPGAPYGAKGSFFGGLFSAVRNIAAPVLSAINPALGLAYSTVRGAMQHPVVSGAAAAATGTAVGAAVAHHYGGAATAAAPGMQVHGHLHIGGRGRRGAAAAPGTRKRRRMNVCNPRALRRAIRRAHGFERMARHVISFPFHKHKAKRGVFKRARKRTT